MKRRASKVFDPASANPLRTLYLLYHEIRETKSDYSYTVERYRFEQHTDLLLRVRQGRQPGLWPEITFDDGHVSNIDVALPVLVERSLQAYFFITVGWTGQKPNYMNWEQLRSLHRAGQRIGAHGWSHKLLTHCTAEQLELELRGARQTLEDRLGTSITTMSLPGGRFNRKVLEACREAGYTQVFTSIPRSESISSETSGSFQLMGRLNLHGDTPLSQIEAMLVPGGSALSRMGLHYRVKTAAQAVLGDAVYAKLWALLNRHEPESKPCEG